MLNVNFKGFLADNMHAYWNVGKKLYDKGDLSLPMVGCEHFVFSIGCKVYSFSTNFYVRTARTQNNG